MNEDGEIETVVVPLIWYNTLIKYYNLYAMTLKKENEDLKEFINWKIERDKKELENMDLK